MLRINFVTYKECLYKECHGTILGPCIADVFSFSVPFRPILASKFVKNSSVGKTVFAKFNTNGADFGIGRKNRKKVHTKSYRQKTFAHSNKFREKKISPSLFRSKLFSHEIWLIVALFANFQAKIARNKAKHGRKTYVIKRNLRIPFCIYRRFVMLNSRRSCLTSFLRWLRAG